MENVLAAFKEKYQVAALALGGYGQNWGISSGLGVRDLELDDVSKAAFLNVDGNVSYSPANDGYREYMELLHDWYEKGYVWPDFISQANNVSDYLISGTVGVATAERDLIQTITDMLQVEDPEAGLIGIKALRKDPDEVLNISYFVEKIIYGTAISATSDHKELAARWLDYCYSPEGQILTNYGVEGEGLQYDADGNPGYTDLVLHNDTYSAIAASTVYSAYGGAMLCYADRINPSYSERVLAALENWGYDTQDWVYPTKVTLTTEQGEAYTTIINEVNSYVAETSMKFIIGDLPINDETWEEYLDNMNKMGLEEVISIKQDALNTYLSNY
jgi:putative aldouronate transport system substrate-binding protein